jgi:hypothetical protein
LRVVSFVLQPLVVAVAAALASLIVLTLHDAVSFLLARRSHLVAFLDAISLNRSDARLPDALHGSVRLYLAESLLHP